MIFVIWRNVSKAINIISNEKSNNIAPLTKFSYGKHIIMHQIFVSAMLKLNYDECD